MKTTFSCFAILLLFFCACSAPEEKQETTPSIIQFELRDSLDLDFLGSPILASVNPNGNRLAFFDYPSRKIIISNGTGEILDTLSKQGDTPDSYGFMIDLPVIYENDKLIQVGMNGVFIYTQQGEMLKKIKHPEDMGGAAFMSMTGKTSKLVQFDGTPYLLMGSIRTRDTYAGEQKFYDTHKAVELVNLETGEAQDFGPFEEGSMFLNGKGYIQSDYLPAFAENNGKLYLSHGGEPKVWIYDFSPTEAVLDTAISLDIPNLFPIEGVDRQELSKGSYSINGGKAAIRNIFVLENKLLVLYNPGIDPIKMEEAEKLWMAGEEEEAEAFYERLEKETPPGILIYDIQTLEYLGKINFPEPTQTGGFTADEQYLYFQKKPNPEVEEDFLRVYKYKLTQE